MDFLINSAIAKEFRKWCENIIFPEEIFFQTLVRVDQNIYEDTGNIVQSKNTVMLNDFLTNVAL